MDPSLAISLHFTLEFIGVAALGGLTAWALQSGKRVVSVAAIALLLVQITHAGQFVGASAGMRAIGWAAAAGSVLVAALGRPSQDGWLWLSGWAGFAGSRLWLAALDPHSGFGRFIEERVGLHVVGAFGALLIGVWAWRRTSRSVRLRIVAAFVLVLFVVVLAAGGPLASVVGSRIQDEQLRRLRTQAEAQRTVFEATSEDILTRAPVVADTVAQQLESGRVPQALASILDEVFTDLSLLAVFRPDRALEAESGLDRAEVVIVSGSAAVTQALRGETVSSLERVPGSLVTLGAAPVFRPGRPPTAENIVGVVVLGDRLDAEELANVAESTGLAVALVSPSRGEVIASAGRRLARLELPRAAIETVADDGIWTGAAQAGQDGWFAAAVPLRREDGSVPAALVLASPDTVLAATTESVSRTLFAAVLAATGVAILIAVLLARRISRPLLDLTAVARRVEAGDLEAKAGFDRGDEVGTLAGAFDAMTSSLRETIATEQQTRSRLETIVGGMGEALIAIDPDFTVVQFNPAAEAITGVPSAQAVGGKCYDVYGSFTRGRDGKPICDYLCPLRFGGGHDGGVAYQQSGGRPQALAVSCSTLHGPNGEVVGGVDLLRDVTPEIEAERMKSNFLANISHELRTPLTPIRGYAEILRRRQMPRNQELQYLAEIVSSTERLERIIKILVDVAAMEAGRLPVMPVPADAGVLVREAVERWSQRSDRHRIRAVVGRDLPTVSADPSLVARVLDELLDNAVKFSPKGGAIVVEAEAVRGGARISVSDRGIGISKQDQDRLFDEFSQVDASETRQFGGLGVGLAFVRRVVEGHRGGLDVHSRPGHGATFSFVLPARRGRSSAKRSARTSGGAEVGPKPEVTERAPAAKRPHGRSPRRASRARGSRAGIE